MRISAFFTGIVLSVTLFFSCAAHVMQFYPDDYFGEDRVYENKSLQFLMTFRGNWRIITDPNKMNKTYKSYAKILQRSGAELLFMGSSVEGLYGVKAIAINLNEPPQEYAAYIRELNRKEVSADMEPVHFMARNLPMVKWVYDRSEYRFVEFFFTVDTYDIRLAFWSKTDMFARFLPVFEGIISTLELTAGF